MYTKMNEDEGFLQLLISLVKHFPALYDKNEKNYYNAPVKQKIWANIGKQCGKSDNKCKHRWKLLRERFTKELKRLQNPVDRGRPYREPWPYFDQLLFLKKSIVQKSNEQITHLPSIAVKSEFISVRELYDDDETMFGESQLQLSPSLQEPDNDTDVLQQEPDMNEQEHISQLSRNVEDMLQDLSKVGNDCKNQSMEGKDFASLLAINMLMQDLPEYMKDEFLKDMYVKVMEMRAKARTAGELENQIKS